MSYVILAGPALATVSTDSRYFGCFDVDQRKVLALVEVNNKNQAKVLQLFSTLDTDLPAILTFLTAILKQYKGTSITVANETAICLALAISKTTTSDDPTLVAAWTALDYVIEAVSPTSSNRVRFLGTGLAGVKQIVAASSVTLTISAK